MLLMSEKLLKIDFWEAKLLKSVKMKRAKIMRLEEIKIRVNN